MENKIASISLKVGMAILFILGLVLIWNNISLSPSSDEDIALTNQSFFVVSHDMPNDEDGKRQEPVQEVFYSYVLDQEAGHVYDLDKNKIYDYSAFVGSKGEKKEDLGNIEEGMVNDLILKNYDFQNATVKSISYTKWLMFIAFGAILVFTIINIVKEPKRFIRSAIGMVALVIIAFVCYKIAPEAGTGKMLETSNYTDQDFHYTGAGILITSTLIVISIGLIVFQNIISLTRFFSK